MEPGRGEASRAPNLTPQLALHVLSISLRTTWSCQSCAGRITWQYIDLSLLDDEYISSGGDKFPITVKHDDNVYVIICV